MEPIRKMKVIPEVSNPFGYKFNVQEWHSYDGGQTFVYAGYGRFCRSIEEVDQYITKAFAA